MLSTALLCDGRRRSGQPRLAVTPAGLGPSVFFLRKLTKKFLRHFIEKWQGSANGPATDAQRVGVDERGTAWDASPTLTTRPSRLPSELSSP